MHTQLQQASFPLYVSGRMTIREPDVVPRY